MKKIIAILLVSVFVNIYADTALNEFSSTSDNCIKFVYAGGSYNGVVYIHDVEYPINASCSGFKLDAQDVKHWTYTYNNINGKAFALRFIGGRGGNSAWNVPRNPEEPGIGEGTYNVIKGGYLCFDVQDGSMRRC